MVKKALDWALRQVGKRSVACHGPALVLARGLAADEPAGAPRSETRAQQAVDVLYPEREDDPS
jgi:3-methyladenine DNA glycosylase AlkD